MSNATGSDNDNISLKPKGDDAAPRPTHMISTKTRRTMMRLQSSHYAIAASLAAAFVAVPAGIYYVDQPRTVHSPGTLDMFSSDRGPTVVPADEKKARERRAELSQLRREEAGRSDGNAKPILRSRLPQSPSARVILISPRKSLRRLLQPQLLRRHLVDR